MKTTAGWEVSKKDGEQSRFQKKSEEERKLMGQVEGAKRTQREKEMEREGGIVRKHDAVMVSFTFIFF